MTGQKIVTMGHLPEWVITQFFSDVQVVIVEEPSHSALLSALDAQVVAIVARGSTLIDSEVMEAAPALRIIARTGAGYNTVDVEAASLRKIAVLHTPGAMSRAVAEHTVALILAAAKDLRGWHEAVLQGNWQDRYHRLNLDLEASTVGIVGLGSIGRQVWHLLQPFDLNMLVTDPYLEPADLAQEKLHSVPLEELLEKSDVVTLHTPLQEDTKDLINAYNIEKFKKGAIFINAARGELVESYDLLHAALESGRLGYVALDTLIVEPPDLTHPIFHHPRALFSAHVAARTARAQERMFRTLGEDMKAVLMGTTPRTGNVVNAQAIDLPMGPGIST
ncbi:MAG: NAD(P)-dependent oxidoreductase [Acidobacteria bacterium]|nr:NAD(P)-dependent oxidoreductase [Acidobacteriota bacterium]